MASLFFWNTDGTRRKLFRPSLQNTLLSQPVETTLLETLQRSSEAVPALNRLLYLELKHFLADHNLNYTDKASMAAGVEVRVPLLDPNLISFASSLSPHFKQNGKTGKYLFKKAMEGILPSDVIYRPKTGFGAPIRSWICGELKDLIAETLSPRAIAQRGVFDSSAVQQLILQTQRGSGDAAYTVFSLLCLELWFQVFVDRRGKI
jgi:asparagine synthase (glutamine-hydrolysing)